MSVQIQVRQHFDREGIEAFPALFEEHRRTVSVFPGFIALLRGPIDGSTPEGVVDLQLEFESEELLTQWRSSPQHGRIAENYRRYWTRVPETLMSPKP